MVQNADFTIFETDAHRRRPSMSNPAGQTLPAKCTVDVQTVRDVRCQFNIEWRRSRDPTWTQSRPVGARPLYPRRRFVAARLPGRYIRAVEIDTDEAQAVGGGVGEAGSEAL